MRAPWRGRELWGTGWGVAVAYGVVLGVGFASRLPELHERKEMRQLRRTETTEAFFYIACV